MFGGGITLQPAVDNAKKAEELSRVRLPESAPAPRTDQTDRSKPKPQGDHVARDRRPTPPPQKFKPQQFTRFANTGNIRLLKTSPKIAHVKYNGIKEVRLQLEGKRPVTTRLQEVVVATKGGEKYIIQGSSGAPLRYQHIGVDKDNDWHRMDKVDAVETDRIRSLYQGALAQRANRRAKSEKAIKRVEGHAFGARHVGTTRVFLNGLTRVGPCYKMGAGSNEYYALFTKNQGGDTLMVLADSRNSNRALTGVTHTINLSKMPAGKGLLALANRAITPTPSTGKPQPHAIAGARQEGGGNSRRLMTVKERLSPAHVKRDLKLNGSRIHIKGSRAVKVPATKLDLPSRYRRLEITDITLRTNTPVGYQIQGYRRHVIRYRAVYTARDKTVTTGPWIDGRSSPPQFIKQAYAKRYRW